MGVIMHLNTEKAVSDPEAVFATPGDLANETGLTRGQKIAALQRWEFTVRERVDAVNEGMTNHAGRDYTDDVELMRRISEEIDALAVPTGGDG